MRYSIIIPVYNVEKYLIKCIESVLKQTCTDYEIILIDDGSIDLSGKICDEYQSRYSFIKVFHQNNHGLACTRNVGLDNAVGKYIVFLDSDDYIEKEFLLKVNTQMEERKFDICSISARRVNEKDETLFEMRFTDMIKEIFFDITDKEEFLWTKFLQYKVGWEACFSVYRRDIIEKNNIRFCEKLDYAEDMPFTYEYLLYANKWIKIPDLIYNYTVRTDSLTNQINKKYEIQGILGQVYQRLRYNVKKSDEIVDKEKHNNMILCSMLLYFIPRFLEFKSMKDIKNIMQGDTLFITQCKDILKYKSSFDAIFEKDNCRDICSYLDYFVGD